MTPKLPGQWTEDDLMALQRQQITERLDLEYKRAEALENTDGKKNEISKDVSAMANSAGGTIIYGIAEDKQTRTIRVTGGIDPSVLSIEWLEQVISSRIQRKIDGVGINPVQLATVDPGKVAYVVSVPQSMRAPHMAYDRRYYKRLGTTTALMEEYEVRDVFRRMESPDLSLDLTVSGPPSDTTTLQVFVTNSSPEPALYASIRVFVDYPLKVGQKADFSIEQHEVLPGTTATVVLHRLWSVQDSRPLLETERFKVGFCELIRNGSGDYTLRWEIRSPKMPTKTGAATLHWGRTVLEITPKT
jgi:hypothetical protein